MSVTVQIVTGILGSGKTSLLRHVLDDAAFSTAVVVGEFAEAGIDAAMLAPSGAKVEQITSSGTGAEAKSYIPPIRKLLDEGGYTHIFIETSGVTEIHAVTSELLSDPEIGARATFGPTAVVLDAGAFASQDEHFGPQLWAQIDAADIVVINKTDQAPEAALGGVRERIEARNTEALVRYAYMGQVRRADLLGPHPEEFIPRILRLPRTAATPGDFESFVFRSDAICFDRVLFGHLLLNLPGARIARFKGTLRSYDRTHCVNGMPGQLDWDNTPVKGPTLIAFIGVGIAGHAEEICARLDAELARQLEDERR